MANAAVSLWTACIRDLENPALAAGAVPASAVPASAVKAMLKCLNKLEKQPPLPHAAWKKLVQDVQVTAKLLALHFQTQQQSNPPGPWDVLIHNALTIWLQKAKDAAAASPASLAAAAVRQQLQESQLLQRLGPAMDAAAAQLTAAVAAATAAPSSSSGSTAEFAATQQGSELYSLLRQADCHCVLLLRTFLFASCALSSTGRFTLDAALPAAPAAVRLMLCAFKACSKLQQLGLQQLLLPEAPSVLHSDTELSSEWVLPAVLRAMKPLAFTLKNGVAATLQSCPGASELLLLPELVPCLAIMSVVTVLGLDTSSDGANGAASSSSSSSTRSSGGSGSGSSAGRQLTGSGRQQQSPLAGSNGSSSSGLSSGVQLDSLAPLACSLFDILGVSREAAAEAARLAKSAGLTTLGHMNMYMVCHNEVLRHQVDQAQGAFSAQLLLQLETDMLLSLAVQQLAASIPDSYRGAQAARAWASLLTCGSLYSLWCDTDLHRLRLPAAYAGPQVALQLLPSPFGLQQLQQEEQEQKQQEQNHHHRQQQQQQQQQQQEQPAESCVLAPSAPLLAELLPLLISYYRTQQQWHQERQQQQPAGPHREDPTSFLAGVCTSLLCMRTLLLCSVVPVCEGPFPITAPAAADAAPLAAPAAAVGHSDSQATYTMCGLDIIMLHASDILSHFEAALRLEAAVVDAAAAAAAVTVMAAADAAAIAASFDLLHLHANLFVRLCHPSTEDHTGQGRGPSPLVLLGLAAGPGSQVYRQLHGLLASLVKLSGWGMGKLNETACVQYSVAAACVASALLSVAAQQPEHRQQQLVGAAAGGAADCSSAYAAVIDTLPSVVIVGRCCMQWAGLQKQAAANPTLTQQQQQQPSNSQGQQLLGQVSFQLNVPRLLSAVQQWLGAGSTCDQLTAAGYTPLPVLQQLEQLSATYQALHDSPPDTVAPLLAAAQQLQSTGLALCCFAVPCLCNNPGCTSMAGPSELAAVSGRSCICAGCRVARYCGRACQRAAWKRHKPVCEALSVAAAAGTGGVVGAVASTRV